MKRLTLILILFLTTKFLLGCQCADKPDIEDAWKYSRQIFIGKVIETNVSKVLYGYGGGNLYTFTIEVEEMFKGELYKKRLQYIFDETGAAYIDKDTTGFYNKRSFLYRGSGSCDYWFEKGKTYLIYAYETDDFLSASICSRTREISDTAISEIRELRKLRLEDEKTKTSDSILDIGAGESDELNLTKEQLIKAENRNTILKYCLLILGVFIVLLTIFKLKKRKK